MTEHIPDPSPERPPNKLSPQELSLALRALAETLPEHQPLIEEAAARTERFDRLQRLMGQLAPGGTAPRTALEEIYRQSETNTDASPAVLDLRSMLASHWGEWTPALREIEGIPEEVQEP